MYKMTDVTQNVSKQRKLVRPVLNGLHEVFLVKKDTLPLRYKGNKKGFENFITDAFYDKIEEFETIGDENNV